MPEFIDLKGKRFGGWKVLKYQGKGMWLALCKCGEQKNTIGNNLRRGISTQCRSCARTIHGMSRSRVYKIWTCMQTRCRNTKREGYGDRGIKVYKKWTGKGGFENFIADVGHPPSPKMQIDRIDNDGDYTPSNVRWTTASTNVQNRGKWPGLSRYKGVSRSWTKWEARIMKEGKNYRLGRFDKEEDAYAAYRKAEQRLYPKH